MVDLVSLNIVELASLNSVVDRFVHAYWNRLFMAWWTSILEQHCWNHHDKSTAMFMHDRTCMLSGNDEITRLNSDVTTTMNLVVVSSWVLHVLTYVNNPCRFVKLYYNILCWNMIEQHCYFTNPVQFMLTMLLHGCWANNPVIACDIFYVCMV